jgi:NAD(P)-dependent dehydrogenase (short-subunit alcohol dehydrogenase family)
MLIDLTDKTALVTGSTEGIGFAAAAGLARSGARVPQWSRQGQG